MKIYRCNKCGLYDFLYSFRGASQDGSYLKCYRCGSTDVREVD